MFQERHHTLSDLSVWRDDLLHLLNDWLGHGVLQDVWLILRMGFLVRSRRAHVFVHHVDVRRGGAEDEVHWQDVGGNIDGGWVDVSSGWHIVVMDFVMRDHRCWHGMAPVAASVTDASQTTG